MKNLTKVLAAVTANLSREALLVMKNGRGPKAESYELAQIAGGLEMAHRQCRSGTLPMEALEEMAQSILTADYIITKAKAGPRAVDREPKAEGDSNEPR